MAGSAHDTITMFWATQDAGDYTALTELFDDDAVLEDPIFGTFTGKEAIGGFFAKMNVEMQKVDVHFVVDEIQGGDESAWARWTAKYGDGREATGVGIYKVSGGKLTYYRDYMDKH
ncbi:MAG: nuclear transport factor 2 family protein [Actinomycetota bacterium]